MRGGRARGGRRRRAGGLAGERGRSNGRDPRHGASRASREADRPCLRCPSRPPARARGSPAWGRQAACTHARLLGGGGRETSGRRQGKARAADLPRSLLPYSSSLSHFLPLPSHAPRPRPPPPLPRNCLATASRQVPRACAVEQQPARAAGGEAVQVVEGRAPTVGVSTPTSGREHGIVRRTRSTA